MYVGLWLCTMCIVCLNVIWLNKSWILYTENKQTFIAFESGYIKLINGYDIVYEGLGRNHIIIKLHIN